ncbi:hypothetical protein CFP56_019925 [Quercus suber]|uniref:Uncharacterized protein n=1 Tax=Quercus suber TaxID=58331 RepID=A0AAW0KIR6_QUESU
MLGDGIDSINNPREIAENDDYLATKLEEDTKRRQNNGQEDVYAGSCAFISHFYVCSLFFGDVERGNSRG